MLMNIISIYLKCFFKWIVDLGLMTSLMTSSRIIIVGILELNISETRPDSGMVTMDGLYKLAYGLSIGHTSDDVK